MPGIELATVFSISLRFIELNALQKSICKIPEELDDVSISSCENLVECLMASAPTFPPTPNCRLWKKIFASKFASLAKHLAISLLKTSPTAIGRMPPFFFNKVDNDALQKSLWNKFGKFPTAAYVYQLSQYFQSNLWLILSGTLYNMQKMFGRHFWRTSRCISSKRVQLFKKNFLTELIGLWCKFLNYNRLFFSGMQFFQAIESCLVDWCKTIRSQNFCCSLILALETKIFARLIILSEFVLFDNSDCFEEQA